MKSNALYTNPLLPDDPEWEKQLAVMSSQWNKIEFYDEIKTISKSNLSLEMRLVCEYTLTFHWLEYRIKNLVWYLYGATSATRANIYMNKMKKEKIFKMNPGPLSEELVLFTIEESEYSDLLKNIANKFKRLSEKRNNATHNLFTTFLENKKKLKNDLSSGLIDLKVLLNEVEKLAIPIGSIAAEVEVESKINKIHNRIKD